MKNINVATVVIIIICTYFNPTKLVGQEKEFAFNRHKTPLSNKQIESFPIDAAIKINPDQHISNEGIKFSIVLKNSSGKNLSIYNIADALTLHLLNGAARDVIIPRIPVFVGKSGGEFKTTFDSFVIKRTNVNGTFRDIDYTNTKNLAIPPNGLLEIDFAIKTVLKNPTPPATSQRGKEGTISFSLQDPNGPKTEVMAGRYLLTVDLVLSVSSESGMFISGGFGVPNIMVNYGN